ncbi:hypothetical protein LTR05_004071 [Lithohypha guttulata]|uniref:CENP-V/GFA domain-containing protein n=1 Tax=Lithohypha guttulata TaxID=1690604 RepID=A0AAN7T155_9EURO|nr:hypothetical protein LTR05_004071 [Lithohypha guttulata]
MGNEIVVRCHCGQMNIAMQLQGSLPHQGPVCHCDSCRHVTGALTLSSGPPLLDPPVDVLKQKLTQYATSPKITRYFCQECGSHVAYHVVAEDRWCICTGAIDKAKHGKLEAIEAITGHEYLADTKDGGLSWCFPNVPCYLEDDGQSPVEDLKAELKKSRDDEATAETPEKLRAECHCGRVKLSIDRPDNGDKWEGGICVCRSCRLSLGQAIVPWLSNVLFEKVSWPDGSTYSEGATKYAKRFNSSEGTWRDFCPECGASVSWHSDKEAGQMDIAAGILRAEEGALARRWINWRTTKIHFTEDAVDAAQVQLLQDNLHNLDAA